MKLILIVFNLKILSNLCDLGKYFLASFRNILPMSVLTFRLSGGLNGKTFLLAFHFEFTISASNMIKSFVLQS